MRPVERIAAFAIAVASSPRRKAAVQVAAVAPAFVIAVQLGGHPLVLLRRCLRSAFCRAPRKGPLGGPFPGCANDARAPDGDEIEGVGTALDRPLGHQADIADVVLVSNTPGSRSENSSVLSASVEVTCGVLIDACRCTIFMQSSATLLASSCLKT
jgi:hypothetical protein